MAQRRPATAGDAIGAIETPALVVDLATFERNLDAMAGNVAAAGLRLRPHAKSHKCPAIAQAQIDRGAVGICCQKTDEALAFIAAGIKDVLVTNEVVAPRKLERLALAAGDARIGLLVDNAVGAHRASDAASAAAATFDVYVDIDVGAHRCGVRPAAAGELAALVRGLPGLRFGGLHCYHGAAQHLRTRAARQEAIVAAQARVREALDAVQARGIACPIVTGAGTGTFALERDSGVWNELQPGSYVFMDADYGRNQLGPGDLRFEESLFVLSSVMSVPTAGRAICDAGLKAFSLDSGLPLVHARDGVSYTKATDEHGVLEVAAGVAPLRLDDRVWLTPGHCDPTVNLYDWIVGVRDDEVVCVWEVAARGAIG